MPKSSLLLKNARLLVTMDADRREIEGGGLYCEDGVICAVGTSDTLPSEADEVVDLCDCIAIPGLVNTHHHMYQSLTRAIPGAQNAELFGWLKTLYPLWAKLTPEMIRISTHTACAELLLSGCTTSSDHLYLFPNGCRLDDSIEAASEIGLRFHASRGAMSVGESQGGLPPDCLVEKESAVLDDCQRLIERWHDPERYALTRIAVAPCSPFSVSRDLMRESARLARAYGVGLHTHLAENVNDIAYTHTRFNCTPAEYVEDLGWVGEDVWHAHCVQLDSRGIELFARTRTGVAHCPSSNMRLASGIAPVSKMLAAGVAVGLGVDGCASNDGAQMLGEARQAMLLARVGECDPAAMSARSALALATLGGAKVLGRNDLGALCVGNAADVAAFNLNQLVYTGASADPLAALVFCAPTTAQTTVVAGRVVVRDGQLTTLELGKIVAAHRQAERQLLNGFN